MPPPAYYIILAMLIGGFLMNLIQNPVQVVTQRLLTSDPNLVVHYPVVVGMANPVAEQRINHRILTLVNKLIIEQGYYQNPRTTIQGWYELKTNERGILSLTIANYAFPYQAAHGLTIIKSLTFNINTGKSYELKDLFKPDSNYIKVLSDIIAVQIKAREIPLLGEFKGISQDQDYYIADKSLVVYFQLYELTPYAYGFPFFPISVYEIQGILKENGPLDKMAVNN